MKKLGQLCESGLVGIGIGMIWFTVDALVSLDGESLSNAKLNLSSFIFWLIASFLIGAFFYLLGLIFNKENWSLRKQIIVNFFVCLGAWLIFVLALNNFIISWQSLIGVCGQFLFIYLLAYGIYFWHLYKEVRQINRQLKRN